MKRWQEKDRMSTKGERNEKVGLSAKGLHKKLQGIGYEQDKFDISN
jgi:hypothetical protein